MNLLIKTLLIAIESKFILFCALIYLFYSYSILFGPIFFNATFPESIRSYKPYIDAVYNFSM